MPCFIWCDEEIIFGYPSLILIYIAIYAVLKPTLAAQMVRNLPRVRWL